MWIKCLLYSAATLNVSLCNNFFCSDGKACTIKRKSAGGGDGPEETPAEGATPEKKAKLSTDAESNGKAEVKA